jgi:hypothetical protein
MRLTLAAALIPILLFATPSEAQLPTAAADSSSYTGQGWGGSSYWGAIPAEYDSVRTTFSHRTTPAWRSVLYLPFRIILIPLWLVDQALGVGVDVVYTSPVVRTATAFAGYIPGPWGSRFRPTVTAGGLAGFGIGVRLEHASFLGPGNPLRMTATGTLNGDMRLSTGAIFRGKRKNELEVGLGFRVRPNARFFGIGPDAVASNRSFYKQQYGWAGGELRRNIGGPFYIEGEALFTTSYADTTTLDKISEDERIQNVFPVQLLAGFGERSSGLGLGLSFFLDNVPDVGRPGGGGIYRLKAYFYNDVDETDIRFWNFRADFQQFVPMWNSKQTLALRAYGSWIESVGDDPVPFQRLMTNDDPDEFRGFKDFRWRDRGFLAGSLEYRWPIWVVSQLDGAGLDFYLLSDVGQVFGDANQIAWDRLTLSYGFGLRAVSTPNFLGRMEFAWSNEEFVFRFVASQDFQFSLGSLLRGREPIPSR